MPRLSKIGAAALAAFGWTGLSSVTASYLQVAGGGGGGNGGSQVNGGGGAGGLLSGTVSLNPTQSYTVVVGAGGAPSSNGANSQFGTLTASVGGGNGAVNAFPTAVTGGSGGSGGGGAYGDTGSGISGSGGSATSGQGNIGSFGFNNPGVSGCGGGGGGSATAATNATSTTAGLGGNGTASSISGTSVTYAGGGGGGGFSGQTAAGTGGTGGGGAGGVTSAAISGTANLGGGGGGSGYTSGIGGNGGSGVVIISYPSPQKFGGGIVTVSGSNTIHTFTTSGTLSPLSTLTASYLIVAGGGGGGGTEANYNGAGGGGAGGLLSGSGVTLDTNSIYAVTVGAGGAGGTASTIGVNGSNSIFSMVSTTAVGGGGGGTSSSVSGNRAGANGGSGGGGAGDSPGGISGGTGTSGQGNAGGSGFFGGSYGGGGGGGASAVGQSASATSGNGGGNGGAGSANPITGSNTGQLDSGTYYLAGGGAGGMYSTAGTGNPGTGGLGGGGNGGTRGGGNGFAGTANTGGGGGGATTSGGTANLGGNGGAGVVVISYAGSTQLMAGGTVTISGGNVIHTFNSSGYLTPLTLVGNSLRFRASASAYLNRTPPTAGNRKTWTWSGWVKRGTLNSQDDLFAAYVGSGTTDNQYFNLFFDSSATLRVSGYSTAYLTSTAVYRDPAAWYHIVCVVDTTQATANNRVRLYVNGTEVTSFSTRNNPSLNDDLGINQAVQHQIGQNLFGSYFDGYLTEINFIDGQALTPNSFGTFNQYGVWQPIRYGGSYGTNGFYLPFNNNSSGASLSASYLAIAGGGAGGAAGGGGGAGGYLTGTTTLNSNSSYIVTVGSGGSGGSGVGARGGDTSFIGLTATGGGGGAYGTSGISATTGGSGGGGSVNAVTGAAGTSGQGFAGGNGINTDSYAGGGGGGASAVGSNASTVAGGNGGAGTASSITGSSVTRAGGGGGGGYNGSTAGTGGAGGGGNGASSGAGASGTANTGSGGGGGANGGNGGSGGSGVVIVSYSGGQRYTGGTVTTSSGNTIHTFTSSGVLTSIFNDQSPQGNNWTPNNFNVSTLGSTYDSMTDVPTLTSTTAANYAVWNPLVLFPNTTYQATMSNANMLMTRSGGGQGGAVTTMATTTGKFYAEMPVTAVGGSITKLGVMATNDPSSISAGSEYALGDTSASVAYRSNGARLTGGTTTNSWGATYTTGDVIGVAFDADTGKVWFAKNGTWQASGDPAAGTNQAATLPTGVPFYFSAGGESGISIALNCGQQPFAYTPPSGFLPLNTFNL